ncbi:hypothetical protein F4781DRAFT_371781 [Annulohypoxylon bovei var. microspora]|nr:hypothetical protein F4781DRAFT_371781 [Annulohypoxylon bovei var. microspora]
MSKSHGTRSVPLDARMLLTYYRQGLKGKRFSEFKSFSFLLSLASHSRASNPRDKIFALESLLPRCMGALIYVDYTENCESVFKRATARCYNHTSRLGPIGVMRFLFESQLQENKEHIGPSWVLDFTYSDAALHRPETAFATSRVTLDGFISEGGLPHQRIGDGSSARNHYTNYTETLRVVGV